MIKASVTVPSNMSDETYNMLINGVKEKYRDEISFTKTVDDGIIGGFILTINGTVYDNSLKTKSDVLKKHTVNQ